MKRAMRSMFFVYFLIGCAPEIDLEVIDFSLEEVNNKPEFYVTVKNTGEEDIGYLKMGVELVFGSGSVVGVDFESSDADLNVGESKRFEIKTPELSELSLLTFAEIHSLECTVDGGQDAVSLIDEAVVFEIDVGSNLARSLSKFRIGDIRLFLQDDALHVQFSLIYEGPHLIDYVECNIQLSDTYNYDLIVESKLSTNLQAFSGRRTLTHIVGRKVDSLSSDFHVGFSSIRVKFESDFDLHPISKSFFGIVQVDETSSESSDSTLNDDEGR